MKILPPSLRPSYRYIAISILSEEDITRHDLMSEVFYAASTLLGDVGSSELGLRIMSVKHGKGIVQCVSSKLWESRAVLASISAVKGTRVRISVMGISGTVKAATEKYLLTPSIDEAEPGENNTSELEECKIPIDREFLTGRIIRKKNNEIDIMPEDSYVKILDRSGTRYIGITIFDMKDKERD